jgi:DNA-binding NarL/FixJ family response regulator
VSGGILVARNTKLRIVVADSDPRVRSALRILLREEPGLELVGESSDLPGLVGQIRELKPDLVLLDWELPGRPAAAMLLAQTALDFSPKVIVFSARPETREAVLAAGADAFVYKGNPPEALLSAFRRSTEESGEGVNDREQDVEE